jgi:hypothetical protein
MLALRHGKAALEYLLCLERTYHPPLLDCWQYGQMVSVRV